jgi:type 1 glutamine amidotransferase
VNVFSNGNKLLWVVLAFAGLIVASTVHADEFSIVYEGENGVGAGKHIVYIASDHEYRGEQTLPALARILAKRYGFKCTVIFGIDPKNGTILPGSSHIGGLSVLKDADLMVIAMRFINMPDEEMQHFVDYVDRGGPIIGLRTSTHAFRIPEDRKFHAYDFRYEGEEFHMGFGRQVLGETWVTHYGKNHEQSSILAIEPENAEHPILRGVTDIHVQAGGYTAYPLAPSTVLARGIILNGMTKDSPVDTSKQVMPVAWVREYESKSSNAARIFTTTQGASEDILNDGFRRMLVNAHLWCMGLEDAIEPDNPIGFVGPYSPTTFSFSEFPRGIKPADLAGWDSPIMDPDAPLTEE